MFDTKSLTLGEVDAIETLSGLPIGALADEDKPKGKALTALAYIIKRRENPAFTFADAAKLTMHEVGALTGSDEDDAPKAPTPEPSPSYSEPELPTSPSSSSDLA